MSIIYQLTNKTMKIKTYEVSIVASNIEAINKAEAIEKFENKIKDGLFGEACYEVEQEKK